MHSSQHCARVASPLRGPAVGLEQQGLRPDRPLCAVASTGLGGLTLRRVGSGLGAAELVAVQADQGQYAAPDGEREVQACLVAQLHTRLDLGDRVVPFPNGEPFDGVHHLIPRQVPAEAELIADPPVSFERGPGLLEHVQVDKDESACRVQRIAVCLPAGASVRQAHGVVDDRQRVVQLAAQLGRGGERGHRDGRGQVFAGGDGH